MAHKPLPFRCVNPACSDHPAGLPKYDFWSDLPTCPRCGASEKDPESAHLILRLAIIHLDQRTKWGKGRGLAACSGQRFSRDAGTGLPDQVNCPECKATEEYRRAAADFGYEVVEEISPERAEELRSAAYSTLKARGAVERPDRQRGVPSVAPEGT